MSTYALSNPFRPDICAKMQRFHPALVSTQKITTIHDSTSPHVNCGVSDKTQNPLTQINVYSIRIDSSFVNVLHK